MKLKYYLRGLGIGIIVTTLVLMICFSLQKNEISDEEVMQRAAELGMVMPEEETVDDVKSEASDTESEVIDTESEVIDTETDASVKENDKVTVNQPSTENKNEQPDNENTTAEPDGNGTEAGEADAGSQSAEVMAPSDGTYRLQVEQGEVCRTICEKLAQNGIIDDSELFRQYLSQIGYASKISTGTYEIPYGLTMEEVAGVLQAGPLEKQR